MEFEGYGVIRIADDFNSFDFISTGKNGAILKRVAFIKTEWEKVYNLIFGDVDEEDEIDYYSVSDNGDRNKILATVIKVIGDYTGKYPDRWIVFKGSTEGRTRLYRMTIGSNYKALSAKFEIYVYSDEKIIPFIKDL